MNSSSDVTSAWYWEGNVVDAIARCLAVDEWHIVAKADTCTKERGIDLRAERNGRTLLIEAKGFPSTSYRDPRRAGEIKRTNPTSQAQRWYPHAFLKAMRLQTCYPDATVAIAFPDCPIYRTLFDETRCGLAKLGVAFLMVDEAGKMTAWQL